MIPLRDQPIPRKPPNVFCVKMLNWLCSQLRVKPRGHIIDKKWLAIKGYKKPASACHPTESLETAGEDKQGGGNGSSCIDTVQWHLCWLGDSAQDCMWVTTNTGWLAATPVSVVGSIGLPRSHHNVRADAYIWPRDATNIPKGGESRKTPSRYVIFCREKIRITGACDPGKIKKKRLLFIFFHWRRMFGSLKMLFLRSCQYVFRAQRCCGSRWAWGAINPLGHSGRHRKLSEGRGDHEAKIIENFQSAQRGDQSSSQSRREKARKIQEAEGTPSGARDEDESQAQATTGEGDVPMGGRVHEERSCPKGKGGSTGGQGGLRG